MRTGWGGGAQLLFEVFAHIEAARRASSKGQGASTVTASVRRAVCLKQGRQQRKGGWRSTRASPAG